MRYILLFIGFVFLFNLYNFIILEDKLNEEIFIMYGNDFYDYLVIEYMDDYSFVIDKDKLEEKLKKYDMEVFSDGPNLEIKGYLRQGFFVTKKNYSFYLQENENEG